MKRMKSALYVFIVSLIFMLMFLPCPASAKRAEEPKVPPNPDVLAEFDQVQQGIAALSTLNKGQQTSLSQKLANAQAAYSRSQPCTALNILDAYLNETQALRKGSLVATAEQLYGIGRFLSAEVLRGVPSGAQCERHESFGREPAITLTASDNTRLAGRISLGEAVMWPTSGGGEQFTKVTIPGVSFIGPPGLPGVPIVQRTIAVPRGATARVNAANPTIAETVRVNLYPFQYSPADQPQPQPGNFGDPPFVKDNEAYASHGPFPPLVCTVTMLGQMRDLTMAQFTCAAGRYDPVDDVLTLFSNVDFDVRFEGGDGYFVTQRTLNPFEPPVLNSAPLMQLLNWPEISKHVDYSKPDPHYCYGEELLIFAPLDLKPAADKLAQWKKQKGILTKVVVFNDPGTFPPVLSEADINLYVKSDYDRCAVRPSYILLFGDAGRVPTWYVTTLHSYYSASDYPYAVGNMPLPIVALPIAPPPSFAVGRIPVDDLEQAEAVVAKIIAYEKDPPPLNEAFYWNASILSLFQCCKYEDFPPVGGGGIDFNLGWDQRSFVETAEFARNVLLSHDYTAERIYTEKIDTDHYFKDLTPRRYADGTDLPPDLAPGSGFAWMQSGSNDAKNHVLSAFNAGRFLILERDHGSWNGWASWQISLDDVDGLTNGPLLPVVFSMSCSTALFDSETNSPYDPYPNKSDPNPNEKYFAERLILHPSGGAIGVIGATRDSTTVSGDVLTRGLFDAVWPEAAGNTAQQRLGDILNHAKLYLLAHQGAVAAWETAWHDDVYLFHVIGDPTLEMWTALPTVLSPSPGEIDIMTVSIRVTYNVEGATITAFQNTEGGMVPIGRAVVKDGVATLDYVVAPREGLPILLSASKANAVSVLLTPEICETCDVK